MRFFVLFLLSSSLKSMIPLGMTPMNSMAPLMPVQPFNPTIPSLPMTTQKIRMPLRPYSIFSASDLEMSTAKILNKFQLKFFRKVRDIMFEAIQDYFRTKGEVMEDLEEYVQ